MSFPNAIQDGVLCKTNKNDSSTIYRCTVIFHDYDNTIMGFYKQFKRHGKSHPLMSDIHPIS